MTGERASREVPDAVAELLRERLAEGARWIDVEGRSMLPTIAPPARVLVEAAGSPRLGEVWVFVDDQRRILAHRYLRRVGDGHRFQGDGNRRADRLVERSRLVGRVVRADDPRGERRIRRRRWRSVVAIVGFGLRRRGVVGTG